MVHVHRYDAVADGIKLFATTSAAFACSPTPTTTAEPSRQASSNQRDFHTDDFVAAVYESNWFVAEVIEDRVMERQVRFDQTVKVKFMQTTSRGRFLWPTVDDLLGVPPIDILSRIEPPASANNRGGFYIEEQELERIEKAFNDYFEMD
jgi:hypothetical protein